MPDRYRIQRNRKDENLEALEKVGKRALRHYAKEAGKPERKGGCWEGLKSCLGLIILLFLCGVIATVVQGQSARAPDDSCFPHKTLYTTAPVELRNDDSRFAKELGKTQVNKIYTVVKSHTDWLFGSCWIQTTRGWMLRRPTGSVIKPGEPRVTSTTRATTGSSKCYTASKAYITGTMNMRVGASTNSKVTKQAHAGDVFTIQKSVQKSDYCWLQTTTGNWIAKTGRVQSTKPVVHTTTTRTTTTRTTTVAATCPSPPIHGSDELKRVVRNAFNALGTWCNYVNSSNPSSIGETGIGCARMSVDNRQLQVSLSRFTCSPDDPVWLASALVHEACHLHQFNTGVRFWYDNLHIYEPPCYRKQIEFLRNVAPGRYDKYIRYLQGIIDKGEFL